MPGGGIAVTLSQDDHQFDVDRVAKQNSGAFALDMGNRQDAVIYLFRAENGTDRTTGTDGS